MYILLHTVREFFKHFTGSESEKIFNSNKEKQPIGNKTWHVLCGYYDSLFLRFFVFKIFCFWVANLIQTVGSKMVQIKSRQVIMKLQKSLNQINQMKPKSYLP